MRRPVNYEVRGEVTRVWGDCVILGKHYEVEVPTLGFQAWRAGELAQRALPGVPVEEREFLISGISPEGWRQVFGE